MTKTQTIATLAERTGLRKTDVTNLLDEVANLAYQEAAEGFLLPGLGKLVLVQRADLVNNSARKPRRIAIEQN